MHTKGFRSDAQTIYFACELLVFREEYLAVEGRFDGHGFRWFSTRNVTETWVRIHQPFFRTFFVLFSRFFYI